MFNRNADKTLIQELIAFQSQEHRLPDIASFIWFGDGVPDTEKRPYLTNIFQFKKLNPTAAVRLYLCKKLFTEQEKLTTLLQQCQANNIIVCDINEAASSFINYDIVTKLLSNPADYVRASAILRMSIMYETGGRYYDCDLKPTTAYDNNLKPTFGFYQYLPEPMRGIAGFFAWHASVAKHPLFLYAATISRYQYEVVRDEEPGWLRSQSVLVRQKGVSILSGNPIYFLFKTTSLAAMYLSTIATKIGYPLRKEVTIDLDGASWADDYKPDKEVSAAEFKKMYSQNEALELYTRRMHRELSEALILEKCAEYFPDKFVPKQIPHYRHSLG